MKMYLFKITLFEKRSLHNIYEIALPNFLIKLLQLLGVKWYSSPVSSRKC